MEKNPFATMEFRELVQNVKEITKEFKSLNSKIDKLIEIKKKD